MQTSSILFRFFSFLFTFHIHFRIFSLLIHHWNATTRFYAAMLMLSIAHLHWPAAFELSGKFHTIFSKNFPECIYLPGVKILKFSFYPFCLKSLAYLQGDCLASKITLRFLSKLSRPVRLLAPLACSAVHTPIF